MTGIAAGDDTGAQAPTVPRIRPESAPELPEVSHTFWPEQPVAEPVARGRIKPPKNARRPAFGLPMLVVFALCAAFFSWVSTEPFLLALGHGDRGTLTVTKCVGEGLSARCQGEFTATTGFTVDKVALAGAADAEHHPGDRVTTRMVSDNSRVAYAGNVEGLHLRWAIGFVFLLLCGAGIMWATGALRLRGQGRMTAVLLSFGGPLLLLLVNLALAW